MDFKNFSYVSIHHLGEMNKDAVDQGKVPFFFFFFFNFFLVLILFWQTKEKMENEEEDAHEEAKQKFQEGAGRLGGEESEEFFLELSQEEALERKEEIEEKEK